jgi:hypothetical protein
VISSSYLPAISSRTASAQAGGDFGKLGSAKIVAWVESNQLSGSRRPQDHLLSVTALPMILSTLFYAASGRFDSHKRIARVTLPAGLYVSVTGVVVFLVLRAYR